MKLSSFKIANFRSIVDSRWVALSPDGITALVGQNESGKSSVLEGLFYALSGKSPTVDDFRTGSDLPVVSFKLNIEYQEFEAELSELSAAEQRIMKDFFASNKEDVVISITWKFDATDSKKELRRYPSINYPELKAALVTATTKAITGDAAGLPSEAVVGTSPQESNSSTIPLTCDDVAEAIFQAMPLGVLFNEASGRLPSQVDIEKGIPVGAGADAVKNFLLIADIDLPALVNSERRARENTLNKANARVSEDFNSFWSQTIGKSGRLTLKCEIENCDDSVAEKAGKKQLVFWILDGDTQLYPKQRSQGVRWFVSFYLQLKASEKRKRLSVFLLDEPGANLHSKAQGDVLKLINRLGKDTSTVIYSTHSPQLLEYSKLFRVHAVQRDDEQDDSPTQIINAHRLGTASTDTLSPILSAMGVDLSNHQVIRKVGNVLLEEMSGYYYLSSFWKLTGQSKVAHFLAATGVNKIEAMANMFRGWGLDFIVAIDDDRQGREVFKSLKRELFGDDDALAAKKLIKLPNCPGIEDAFSADDFRKYVLKNASLTYAISNAEHVKSVGLSKPVLAFQFALLVEGGTMKFSDFDTASQQKITAIVDAIAIRLPEGHA